MCVCVSVLPVLLAYPLLRYNFSGLTALGETLDVYFKIIELSDSSEYSTLVQHFGLKYLDGN